MSTQQDSHETKVRRIAEILAKIDYEERYSAFCDESSWDALDQYAQEVAIYSQMRAAREMVAEMDKMYNACYIDAISHMKANFHCYKVDRDLSLIERGLIP